MAIERRVTHSKKDSEGDILGVKNPLSPYWDYKTKKQIISNIESGNYEYYTHEESHKSYIYVYKYANNKHIKTNADATSKNNLDNLPDC